MHIKYQSGKLKGGDNLREVSCVDRKIILKRVIRKYDVKWCTRFVRLRIG
jgi:hypothetical protein